MKRIIFTSLFFLIITLIPALYKTMTLYPEQNCIVLEDFETYGSNPFPAWESREAYDKVKKIYSVMIEGDRKFLHASTLDYNKMIQIGRPIKNIKLAGSDKSYWDIYQNPYIQWEWRVHVLPKDANENTVNDSAAAIYVVFPRKNLPVLDWEKQPADWLKYVWSSTQPVGTVVKKHVEKFGVTLYNGKTIVVATGGKNLKKWITFRRNVLQDYRTYFGKNPKYHPSMIGILTDANSTKSSAIADYDNIMICPN